MEKIFASALSLSNDAAVALQEATGKIKAELGSASCDLAFFFLSDAYDDLEIDDYVKQLQKELGARCLIGCNASGVIGDFHEAEFKPALTILAMHLPEVKVVPFSLLPVQLDKVDRPETLIDLLDIYPNDQPKFVCMGDPMTCDITKFLDLLNQAYPNLPCVGGLASSNLLNRPSRLWVDDEVYDSGIVGVALSGNVDVEVVISQGCRPIGEPYAITKAEDNIIYEVASRPVMHVLQEMFERLNPKDQNLARESLFVGLAMDERKTAFGRGDFLIRNILAADNEQGAIAVGAIPQIGQTLQFQLRDAESSYEDLLELLQKHAAGRSESGKGAALVISCCGRGQNLFGQPDHDIKMIQSLKGPIAVAGFFANGELGPVDKKNYIHGYTSSITFFK